MSKKDDDVKADLAAKEAPKAKPPIADPAVKPGDKPAPPPAESDHVDQPDRPAVGAVEAPPPGHKVREKAGEEPKPAEQKSLRPPDANVPDDKGLQHALRKAGRLFRVRGGGETRLVEAADAEEARECFAAHFNGEAFEPDREKRAKAKASKDKTPHTAHGPDAAPAHHDPASVHGSRGTGLTAETAKEIIDRLAGGPAEPVTPEACSAFKLPE
jgi:hypothetical protein